MENTKTTLTNLDTGVEAIVELDGDSYELTINKPYTHIRHKDRNVLLQKAWQAVSVLVLLALSACGDNLCGCPFGMVCQPAPRQEGFVCVAPPQASDVASPTETLDHRKEQTNGNHS